MVTKVQSAHLGQPLLKACLSDKQWEVVEYINQALRQEYETRRDMLLKRLDVTIQSFTWSDKAKVNVQELLRMLHVAQTCICCMEIKTQIYVKLC